MTRFLSSLSAIALSAAMITPALARDADGQKHDGPRSERSADNHDRRGGGHHRMRGPSVMDVAGKLAAAKVVLAIIPDQEDEWNAVSGALVDFMTAGRPDARGPKDRMKNDRKDDRRDREDDRAKRDNGNLDGQDARSLADLPPVKRLKAMVESGKARNDAGEKLVTAIEALSNTMTPEQVGRAQTLFREMRHEGMKNHHRKRDHHRNEREEKRGQRD